MRNVLPFERRSGLFGACPWCRRFDGHAAIGRDHFRVCHRHRARWLIVEAPGVVVHDLATRVLLHATQVEHNDLVHDSVRVSAYRIVEACPAADHDNPEPPPPTCAA